MISIRSFLVLCVFALIGCLFGFPLSGDELEDGQEWKDKNAILYRDITTSGYYELIELARAEGLSLSGDQQQLRDRMFKHYEINPDDYSEKKTEEQDELSVIVVESAEDTRFFETEDNQQDMFVLQGGVVMYIEDTANDQKHRIKADRVIFNRSEEVITAHGNIEYALERGDDVTEQYSGETLTFRLEDWSGGFAEGTTTRERTIEESKLDFRYSGSFITRSGSDVVVMDGAEITSSVSYPPNYTINAERIWVFAPGEWGLRNAVLYVGRIPLFYFPFYFSQGREFFFSPGIASFMREGQAVYTTTYLFGDRDRGDSPVSLLQLAETPDRSGRRRIKGLYYEEEDSDAPKTAASGQNGQNSQNSQNEKDDLSLKIMADLYSNLGAFLAVDGSVERYGPLKNIDYFAGIGRTREIFVYSQGYYSPWYETVDGLDDLWHTSYLGGAVFPFRYGFSFAGTFSHDTHSVNSKFAHYSDATFVKQQSMRSEEFQVLQIITSPEPPEPVESEVNRYAWNLYGSSSIKPLPSFISSLTVNYDAVRLDWIEKSIPYEQRDPVSLLANASPSDSFFVPSLLVLPNVRMNIRGTIFDSGGSRSATTEGNEATFPAGEGVFPLLPPWESDAQNDIAAEEKKPDFMLPALRTPLPVPSVIPPLRYRSEFVLTPEYQLQAQNLTSNVLLPKDAAFEPRYWDGRLKNIAQVSQQVSVFERYAILKNSFDLETRYNSVWDNDEEYDEVLWRSAKINSLGDSMAALSTSNNMVATPLADFSPLRNSSIAYDFNTKIAEYRWTGLDLEDPDPDDSSLLYEWENELLENEWISRHRLLSTLAVSVFDREQKITYERILPPLDQMHLYGLQALYGIGWYSGSLSVKASQDLMDTDDFELSNEVDGELVWDPLVFSNKLALNSRWFVEQTSSWDIEEERFQSTRFAFQTGILRGNIQYLYILPYELQQVPVVAWVQKSEEEFVLVDGLLALDIEYKPEPFWKDRVQIAGMVSSQMNVNFQRFTESNMVFVTSLMIDVFEFLKFELATRSSNPVIYAYIPELAEQVGVPSRNMLNDILDGFTFWDEENRRSSNFKLEEIQFAGVYRMGDWDFYTVYSGKPELLQDSLEWEWENSLKLELVWKPVSEFNTEITIDNDGITY